MDLLAFAHAHPWPATLAFVAVVLGCAGALARLPADDRAFVLLFLAIGVLAAFLGGC